MPDPCPSCGNHHPPGECPARTPNLRPVGEAGPAGGAGRAPELPLAGAGAGGTIAGRPDPAPAPVMERRPAVAPGDEVPEAVILGGRYRLGRVLGQGGQGEVYEALDPNINGTVAVKRLGALLARSAEAIERFRAEMTATVRVQHPNIVKVLDSGVDGDGRPYFVMELLQGTSLATTIHKRPLSVERTLAIADQILRGVGWAHGKGVVHRDLKPSNVMISDDGYGRDVVKVVDFGIAKLQEAVARELTSEGMILGSRDYMAPEVARGERRALPTIDVFALGVILYEMLTGASPWDIVPRDLRSGTLAANEVPRVRDLKKDLPQPLDDIVARAMAADPKDRFQTTEELRMALAGVAVDRAPATGSAPASVPELGPGVVVADAYRIRERLGEGGSAKVYLADDVRIARVCVLKLLSVSAADLDPSTKARFFADAAHADKINHPHVVRVFSAGEWRGHCFLVMEHVTGDTLRVAGERLPWRGLVSVVEQVAGALEAVHRAQVVHRDVKPENILVDDQGRAKLLDFGTARAAGSEFTKSVKGEIIGSYGYMAPEQAHDPRKAGPASDQWSLAAIVYERLTGRRPHAETDHDDTQDYFDRLTSKRPPVAPGDLNASVRTDVAAVLLRALSYDPAARFPSPTAFAHALAAASSSEVPALAPASRAGATTTGASMAWSSEPRRLPRRRLGVLSAAGVVVVVGALLLLGGRWMSSQNDGTQGGSAGSSPLEKERDVAAARVPAPDPTGTDPAGSTPTPAKEQQSVTFELEVKPVGAKATADGQRYTLPATWVRAPGSKMTVVVEHEGFVTETLDIVFSEPRGHRLVVLKPLARPERSKSRASGAEPRSRTVIVNDGKPPPSTPKEPTPREPAKPAGDPPVHKKTPKGDRDGVLGPN